MTTVRAQHASTPGRCRTAAVPALTACILAAVGACAPYPLRGEDPKIATMTVEVPTNDALILPEPGGPTVLAVLETRYLNALEQEIVLGTRAVAPGQNSFHVIFFGPVDGRTGRENIRKDDRLSDEVLQEEMEERLPGIAMHTSTYFVQNRYGPFGYAIGRGGAKDLCIYGWQRIESKVPLSPIVKDRGVLAVRLRLCQTGATEQQLLRMMYRFTINGYYLPRSWQPYGRPLAEPEGIGRVGGPLAYPTGIAGDATVLDGVMGPEPRPVAPRRATRREEPAATGPQSPSTPLAGYPAVPMPGAAAAQPAAVPTAPASRAN